MSRLLAVLLAAFAFAPPAAAEAPHITIVGTGTVAIVPDLAVVIVGIETEEDTAAAAQAASAAAAAGAILALRRAGVGVRDIRTETFHISPVDAGQGSAPAEARNFVAYRVINRIEATVRDIGTLGELLDAVVAGGASRIDGLRLGVSNAEAHRDEARRRAVTEATRRAQMYARAMGAILGPIRSLTEGARRPRRLLGQGERRAPAPLVDAGPLEITETVTMTWAIYDE